MAIQADALSSGQFHFFQQSAAESDATDIIPETRSNQLFAAVASEISLEEWQNLKAQRKSTQPQISEALLAPLTVSATSESLPLRSDAESSRANRVYALLMKLNEEWYAETLERDLRDSIADLTAAQISQLHRDFKQLPENKGQISFIDAANTHEYISQSTKDALILLCAGCDHRSQHVIDRLADIALKKKDIIMFQEVFRDASAEARSFFISHEGERRILEAFGAVVHYADPVAQSARPKMQDGKIVYEPTSISKSAVDIAKFGKVSPASTIEQSTSFWGDGDETIDLALAQMDENMRLMYAKGKRLDMENNQSLAPFSLEDELSKEVFRTLSACIKGCSNERETIKREDHVFARQGGLVSKLLETDSQEKYVAAIENMTKEDWQVLIAHGEAYRELIEKALRYKQLPESSLSKCMELVDQFANRRNFQPINQNDVIDRLRNSVTSGSDLVVDLLKEFHSDPFLVRRLNNPQSDEDQRIAQGIRSIVKEYTGPYASMLSESMIRLLRNGQIGAKELMSRFKSTDANLFRSLNLISREDRERLLTDDKYRNEVFVNLDEEKRMVALNILTELERADRLLYKNRYERNATEICSQLEHLLRSGELPDDPQVELLSQLTGEERNRTFSLLEDVEAAQTQLGLPLDKTNSLAGLKERLNARELIVKEFPQGILWKPEDRLRAFLLGVDLDIESQEDMVRRLSPQQLQRMKIDYASKYGQSLDSSCIEKTEALERERLLQLLKRDASAQEQLDYFRTRYYDSEGFGRQLSDLVWDDAGSLLDNAYHRLMEQSARTARGQSVSKAESDEAGKAFSESEANLGESKGKTARTAFDIGITLLTLGGGSSALGIARAMAAGAFMKPAMHSAIEGSAYQSSKTTGHAILGSLEGVVNLIGPSHLLSLTPAGRKAAAESSMKLAHEIPEHVLAPSSRAKLTLEGNSGLLARTATTAAAHAVAGLEAGFLSGTGEELIFSDPSQPMLESFSRALKAGAISGATCGLIGGVLPSSAVRARHALSSGNMPEAPAHAGVTERQSGTRNGLAAIKAKAHSMRTEVQGEMQAGRNHNETILGRQPEHMRNSGESPARKPPSLLQAAEQAGGREIVGEGRLQVFVHGGTETRALPLIENQGDNLTESGGNFGGKFYAALDANVALEFAERKVTNEGGKPKLVGIAMPASIVEVLKKEQLLVIRKIPDRQGQEVIFMPGAFDRINELSIEDCEANWFFFDLDAAREEIAAFY